MKRKPGSLLAGTIIGFGVSLSASATTSDRSPVLTTPHFAFFSGFDANLNDSLIAAGLARKNGKAELFGSGEEVPCFGALPLSARAAWNRAVDYYADVISPANWTDREQYLLRVQIAGFDEEWKDEADRQFVEIARSFRKVATPAYEACRWKAQDAKNRRWIEELKPRLEADEAKIADRLAQLYGQPWTGLPIPVDVVEVVNWAGANSILRDSGGGHLLISSSDAGPAALETVFHESSHILMGRGAPVRKALQSAAAAANYELPRDLWHVVLFYTTGEVVRSALASDGETGYTPMLNEIMARGDGWQVYRLPLEKEWKPYVEGRKTLDRAAAGLIKAIKK